MFPQFFTGGCQSLKYFSRILSHTKTNKDRITDYNVLDRDAHIDPLRVRMRNFGIKGKP